MAAIRYIIYNLLRKKALFVV